MPARPFFSPSLLSSLPLSVPPFFPPSLPPAIPPLFCPPFRRSIHPTDAHPCICRQFITLIPLSPLPRSRSRSRLRSLLLPLSVLNLTLTETSATANNDTNLRSQQVLVGDAMLGHCRLTDTAQASAFVGQSGVNEGQLSRRARTPRDVDTLFHAVGRSYRHSRVH